MIIFPAIDLYNKEVVRLTKGLFDSVKTYQNNPLQVAQSFEQDGAKWLHIIDLNGAQDGTLVNTKVIKQIVDNTNLNIQVGGGIRSIDTIKAYLSLGVNRVILGSYAVWNMDKLPGIMETFQDQVIVSVDSKDGYVRTSGWQTASEFKTIDFCIQLEQAGVKTIVYTDIDKDGMLEGTDIQTIDLIQTKTSLSVIASGGVTTYDEIKVLNSKNTYGAIIGKALYEEKLKLKEVISCLQEESFHV